MKVCNNQVNAESRKGQLENIKVFWCFNLPLPHSIPEAIVVLNQSHPYSQCGMLVSGTRVRSADIICRLLGLRVLCWLGLLEGLCKCSYVFCLHQNSSQRGGKCGWKTLQDKLTKLQVPGARDYVQDTQLTIKSVRGNAG